MKQNSLRFQLLARSLLLMAALLAVVGILQYVFMKSFVYKNQATSIQNEIQSVPPQAWFQIDNIYNDSSNNSQDNGSIANPQSPPNNFFSNAPHHSPIFFIPGASIAIVNQSGHFSVLPNPVANAAEPPKLSEQDYQNALSAKHEMPYQIVNQTFGGEQLIVLQSIPSRGHPLGVVEVSLSTKPLKNMMLHQLFVFMALALLALAAGLLAYIPVLRKTLVPLSNMVNLVEQINAGNLDERLPIDQGQEEIDRLALSFNGMLERLESSFTAEKESKEQMRRFVADASHELRTPLTVIHGFLEVLLRGAVNQPDMLDKSVKSMFAEAERMKKLVEDLLLLAKLDRTPTINLSEGELDDVIKEMAPQMKLLAGERKVSLRLTSTLKCFYDEDKIKQVILNLFHNAVQHTDPEKGEIQISLTRVDGGAELEVRDNGVGISEEHLPYLFDRFYRSDSSRTRKYGGAGLGLAITKSLVHLQGGTIRVESKLEEGTIFSVWLPASNA
jgi:two-component system OmpR family sensor kinase